MIFKKLHIGPYEYILLLLVVLASTLRIVLISQHWPVTNSDEAIMGLMALHINTRGEHPLFFYGQAYMGPVEAYIGALCFRLFGQSIFSLRIGLIPFFALFLISIYFLTRKLYNKPLALFTVVLLCLGSSDIFARELKAIGGYPEIPFLGSFIFFLCCKLALSSSPLQPQPHDEQKSHQKQQRSRWLLYGLLGLLVGLAIWIDQLLLPYIVTALLLLLFCWRDLFSRYGLVLLLGIIIGILPLISYDLTAPFNQNFLLALLNAHNGGQQELLAQPTPFLRQLSGTFLISLPTMTGFNPLCTMDQFPPFSKTPSWTCVATQGGWSLGYLFLWICAILMVSISLWRLHSSRQPHQIVLTIQQIETRQQKIVDVGRLLLLISALLTLLQYLGSPSSGLTPNTSARYLDCMLISTPAILWPLWSKISTYRVRKLFFLDPLRLLQYPMTDRGNEENQPSPPASPDAGDSNRKTPKTSSSHRACPDGFALGSICLLIFISSMFLVGTIRIVLDISGAQNEYNREQALMQTLLNAGVTRFYSEYWTCNHLIFRSNERLICSNLNGGLQADPVLDRYQPYRDNVRESRTTTYVFPQGSSQQQYLDSYLQSKHTHYTRREFKGYIIYQMATPIGIP